MQCIEELEVSNLGHNTVAAANEAAPARHWSAQLFIIYSNYFDECTRLLPQLREFSCIILP